MSGAKETVSEAEVVDRLPSELPYSHGNLRLIDEAS